MKKQRNLDGYIFRILRDAKVQNICLSDMSDYEIDRIIDTMTKDNLKAVVKGLSNRLYQIGEGFNIQL